MSKIPDKHRSTFPVAVTFSEGELPTDVKMNAISRQAKSGLGILEYVVGDVWNQGGDALLQAGSLTGNALMIPNLARFVGASKYTSPFIPYLGTNVDTYIYSFALDTATEYEAQLTFPPAAGTSYTWSGTSTPVAGQLQANASDVNSTGDWWIDTDTGFCRFYDPIQTDWLLFYNAQVDGDLGSDAYFNIMPDPWTETSWTFQSCKIAYANDVDNTEGYLIFLPPRGPLQSARLFSSFFPQSRYDASGNVYNDNPAHPDAGSRTFWQSRLADGATAAGYAEHYRYNLPTFITDNWSANSLLPTGSIYLWDSSQTGTVIEGVSLYAENAGTPRVWVLKASGAALDTWVSTYGVSAGYPASLAGTLSDHSSTYYPSGGLKVIISGSPISQTVSYLRKVFWSHDHGSSSSMPTRATDHNKLKGLFDAADAQVFWTTLELILLGYGSADPKFVPSMLDDDDHPQYLHRFGATFGNSRDRYYGGMLGDLLLCSKNPSGNHLNVTEDSRRVVFGDPVYGPAIFYDNSSNILRLGTNLGGSEFKTAGYAMGESPYSQGGYGYSASSESNGYGKVRRMLIPAQNFVEYQTNSTADAATPNPLSTSNDLQHIDLHNYSVTYSIHESQALYLDQTGAYKTVANAYLQIPFAKFCIVDVELSCYPFGGSWTGLNNVFFCDIGSANTDTSAGLPTGTTEAYCDLYDVFYAGVAGSFPAPTAISAAYPSGLAWQKSTGYTDMLTEPLMEVDRTGGTIDEPYIRFRSLPGGSALYIRDIVVLYRVKEF